jgi:hypothetical protein
VLLAVKALDSAAVSVVGMPPLTTVQRGAELAHADPAMSALSVPTMAQVALRRLRLKLRLTRAILARQFSTSQEPALQVS